MLLNTNIEMAAEHSRTNEALGCLGSVATAGWGFQQRIVRELARSWVTPQFVESVRRRGGLRPQFVAYAASLRLAMMFAAEVSAWKS